MGNLPGCSEYSYCHGGNGKSLHVWYPASATATSHPQARQENRAVALVSLVQVLFETLCDSKASPVARYGSKIHSQKKTSEIYRVQR